ncbi:MAG: hypothetical protein JWN41_68 [Thermoleophilia bacterium]|nr:hypothetical protein [Thermoleophilia bacterium]
MKVWSHVIASIVGLLLAGLIVFLVFGNASKEGALQDGTAGGRGSSDGTLCGSIAPAATQTFAARAKALKNPPSLISATGTAIRLVGARQNAWLARVQAASGLCIDEISIGEGARPTKISMSTVDGVTEAEASAYTGAALFAANQVPLNHRNVQITTFVGDQKRSIFFTVRAYNAFLAGRAGLRLGTSAHDLVRFRRIIGSGLSGTDIRINGWR